MQGAGFNSSFAIFSALQPILILCYHTWRFQDVMWVTLIYNYPLLSLWSTVSYMSIAKRKQGVAPGAYGYSLLGNNLWNPVSYVTNCKHCSAHLVDTMFRAAPNLIVTPCHTSDFFGCRNSVGKTMYGSYIFVSVAPWLCSINLVLGIL
jgi:hypothetical protein